MNICKFVQKTAPSIAALVLIMVSAASWGDVQVRSEAAVLGSSAAKDDVDSVIVPDLTNDIRPDSGPDVTYTDWVSPKAGREFDGIDFLPTGGLLVKDGTVYREFKSDGSEKLGDIFPFDCRNVEFAVPKGKNNTQTTSLSTCSASVITLGNTMRIFGTDKGKGLVAVALDLSVLGVCTFVDWTDDSKTQAEWTAGRTCVGHRTADDTPPLIIDAIADEGE